MIYKDIIIIFSYYLNSRMLKNSSVLNNGLNIIEKLDARRESRNNRKRIIDKYLAIYDAFILFEKKNHNGLQDHYDKKSLDSTSTSTSTSVAFPNALLLEEYECEKKDVKDKVIIDVDTETNENDEGGDIWYVLNKMERENDMQVQSEALDMLTTDDNNMDSDTEVDTDTITVSDTCFDAIVDKKAINKKAIIVNEGKNNKCKGCKSVGTMVEDQQAGVIVCSDCGMINEELLDHGPEWRQYNNDDSRGEGVNRCGCPSNYFFPKASQGTIMAGTSNNRLKRKQKWNSMVYKERSLTQVFELISTYCSKNNIPKIIIDSAKILYKNLSDCKHKSGTSAGRQIIIRGINRASIIAACVFKACEMNKSPRSIKEIAVIFELGDKKVTKGIKEFNRIMKNADNNLVLMQCDSNIAEDYIRRHCPKLKINKADTNLAVTIALNCCKMKLASDHNPQSIAAGAILLMKEYNRLNLEKKEIAALFGTTIVTISKIYKKIYQYVDALVDNDTTNFLIKKFKING